MVKARITRVEFENFKAFARYSVQLEQVSILVGPNNSGKSTIIGAFRALDKGLRIARSRPPQRVHYDETSVLGYRIPKDSLPIALGNVHTNYSSQLSTVKFILSNKNYLELIFPVDGGCALVPYANSQIVTSAAAFKRMFPITLTTVPVLGPVENSEVRREKATVVDGLSTHRASRHFRNFWYFFPEAFETFAEMVSSTWPGMEIGAPELDISSGELTMFCKEGRFARELYWVGFGFQVWCQLLTHLSRSKDSSMVIMDEPETYLHPDVQRKLLSVVRDVGTDVLMATHSSEIMSEADPSEIVMIDKQKLSGERLRSVSGVQRALEVVGSGQNITLTALARSRRVLFVEGDDDFKLLRRFARQMGLQELSYGSGIVALPSGGFGSWQRVTILAAGISDALGCPLLIAAIYDSDFFCAEQIGDVEASLSTSLDMAHMLKRKEIENYMLVPSALDRAIRRAIDERDARGATVSKAAPDVLSLLEALTAARREDTLAQVMGKRGDYLKGSKQDSAVINRETLRVFEKRWASVEGRLEIVPGKEVLRDFRSSIQASCGVSLTDARIIGAMNRNEIPEDLRSLLQKLEVFRTSTPP